jgi:tRNA nucleotidyltransferase (CCA-adding enzyme)
MKIEIPAEAAWILKQLNERGFEAYVVGGCVRDSLLGRTPYDWDITTSALPEQVKEIFPRTVDTGIAHGTVTVMYHKEGYEVTTYRVDGEYEDGRHPKDVTFTASLREDLRRRDFTINAMAYHPELGLVDLFGGLEDLKDKKVRCVGDPLERFTEDALRIMRAVRFSAQLGFTIEEETYHALSVLAPNLHQISAERIRTELEKILLSPHPDYVRTAYETGMTKVFLPEWDACMETPQNTPHHCYTVGEHILHTLSGVPAERILRLTLFLHDIGKPVARRVDENGRDHFKGHGPVGEKMAHTILRRLKYDNDTIAAVSRLVKWHDARPNPDMRSVRRAVNRIGDDLFPLYLKVRRADTLAQSTYRREEKLRLLDETEACYQEICRQKQCTSLKTLAVNGRDLITLGYPTGKQIGFMLNLLLEHVLDQPQDNERDRLLELLPQLLEDSKESDN